MFSSYSFHQEFKFLKSKNKSGRLIGETEQSKALGKQFWEQSTCWPHVNCHLGEGTKWGHHSCPPSCPSHLQEKIKMDIKQEIDTTCHVRREKKRAGGKEREWLIQYPGAYTETSSSRKGRLWPAPFVAWGTCGLLSLGLAAAPRNLPLESQWCFPSNRLD